MTTSTQRQSWFWSLGLPLLVLMAPSLRLGSENPFLADDFERSGPPESTRAATAPAAEGLSSLPPAAQAQISAALGRDHRSYHAFQSGKGFRAENRGHGLDAEFGPEGVGVRAGEARFGMALRAYGYGDALRPLAPIAPRATANRVEYRHGALTEWYVNGPLGLEQGFTLESPPGPRTGGPLTLALGLSGDLTPSVEPGGDALALRRKDGQTALRYGGLVAYDAEEREVPAWLEIEERRLLLRVNDAGARYPLVVDPLFETAKLAASDGAGGHRFGTSVAINDDTVVVGATGHSSNQGAAYVFVKAATGWANMIQTAKLTASDGAANDQFGGSVAISGDAVVVGAGGDDIARGSAYVFVKPATGWANMTQTAKLTAADGTSNDGFGSVAISGDTVVVGAGNDTIGVNTSRGSAYVFVKPATGWTNMTQTAKLTASDGAGLDGLGQSVAISGDTVVAGAHSDDAPLVNQGSAYVFVKPATGWVDMTQTAKLTASDAAAGHGFGGSVAISGDTIVSGASGGAAAYVFVKPAGGWVSATQTAKLTASDAAPADLFGVSVAISGDRVVVGAAQDDAPLFNQGSAYMFVKPGGGWLNMTETDKLTASDGVAGDLFGGSVTISGATVVGGAPAADIGRGFAYVFELPCVLTLTRGVPTVLAGTLGDVDATYVPDFVLVTGYVDSTGSIVFPPAPILTARVQYDLLNRCGNGTVSAFRVDYALGTTVIGVADPSRYIDNAGMVHSWGGLEFAELFDSGFGTYNYDSPSGSEWSIDYEPDHVTWNQLGAGFLPGTATGFTNFGFVPTFALFFDPSTPLGLQPASVAWVGGGAVTSTGMLLSALPGGSEPTLEQRTQALIDTVSGLPTSAFSNANNKRALLNKLREVQTPIAAGSRCDLCRALSKLVHDILPKTDGETPPPDWVKPAAQANLEGQTLVLIHQLQSAVNALGGCGGC